LTMAQAYFSLVTHAGRIKLAASAAGGAPVTITHFAVGDGNGADTNPTTNSTALVREVWRTQVESVATDPNNPSAILVTAIIPTNAGGWWMREFGIFDKSGTMIAVARPVSQYKPTALEGQLEDIRYEFQIIIGEAANVTLLVDPSLIFATRDWVQTRKIPMTQMNRLPWLPVISMTLTAPPNEPPQGGAWLVPSNASGAWAGKGGMIAEWVGKEWFYSTPADGHGVGLPNGQVFMRIAGQYVELLASDIRAGLVELATIAEAKAGKDTGRAVTPAGLAAAIAEAINTLVNGSPAALDTLRELADALGNDAHFATTITNALAGKVDLTRTATETRTGIVELATILEALAGNDTERAVTPAGLSAAITAAITKVINGSPAALDTLQELATALGNDSNFAATMANALAGKVDITRTATEARSGIVELATIPEAKAGTNGLVAVTPPGLVATIADIMPPRPNLCPNGGFEDGLAGIESYSNGSAKSFTLSENMWGRNLVVSGPHADGWTSVVWPKFTVVAGLTYTIAGDAALFAEAGTAKYELIWYRADGTDFGFSGGLKRGTGDFSYTADARQAMAISVVAPVGAVAARLSCVFENVKNATVMCVRLAKVEFGGLPATAYTPPAGKSRQPALYTYINNGVFTVPEGVYFIRVRLWGGGAGGGGVGPNGAGGGGGGGGYAEGIVAVVPGQTYTITIGQGGGGGAAGGGNGGNGGTTSFGALLSATGGLSGYGAASGYASGNAGGTAAGGQIQVPGQAGQRSLAQRDPVNSDGIVYVGGPGGGSFGSGPTHVLYGSSSGWAGWSCGMGGSGGAGNGSDGYSGGAGAAGFLAIDF
jgi:hypothetical protein